MAAAGIACSISSPVTSTQYILRGFALQQQMSFFNVVAGTSASFANLFSTATDLELSGFRFTNPALAACFTTARSTDTRPGYRPCVQELQTNSYWIPGYIEGQTVAVAKGTKVGTSKLPNGATRPILLPSGIDFASITVS